MTFFELAEYHSITDNVCRTYLALYVWTQTDSILVWCEQCSKNHGSTDIYVIPSSSVVLDTCYFKHKRHRRSEKEPEAKEYDLSLGEKSKLSFGESCKCLAFTCPAGISTFKGMQQYHLWKWASTPVLISWDQGALSEVGPLEALCQASHIPPGRRNITADLPAVSFLSSVHSG